MRQRIAGCMACCECRDAASDGACRTSQQQQQQQLQQQQWRWRRQLLHLSTLANLLVWLLVDCVVLFLSVQCNAMHWTEYKITSTCPVSVRRLWTRL